MATLPRTRKGPGSRWLAAQGWKAFPFQREVAKAIAAGESGLLHATTGSGKTYAVWLAALDAFVAPRPITAKGLPSKRKQAPPPLTVLWLTSMRALAADTLRALERPVLDEELEWTLGLRTGATGSSERARQNRRLPTALVTTPESLSLLLSREDAQEALGQVRLVVIDEWHELLGNKRGTQTQLALARLRRWNPGLQTWGLSATLGNQAHALDVLLAGAPGQLVQGRQDKRLQVDTLLPEGGVERFAWAGHLGMRLLQQVIRELEDSPTTLVFTNTRAQTELWYQALLQARPDWAGLIALHHGSIEKQAREWVEAGLKNGLLKAVICTSSLDLGVDFLPVERVLQIGSPKSIARLLQRAGRSGHAPGRASRATLVPTYSLDLLDAAATRRAITAGEIEARTAPVKPLDVLVQHLVTVALGGGFEPDDLLPEIRSAWAYRHLSEGEWIWALAFVRNGGASLSAYPDYRRAEPDAEGIWRVPDKQLAKRHRLGIGTIVSETSLNVQFWSKGGGGNRLGNIEEGFIARLRPGDHFLFAGRTLELVRVENMTVYVRRASGRKAAIPRWSGSRMPLSDTLAQYVLALLEDAEAQRYESPEMRLLQPLLDVQRQWSALPSAHYLLAETLESREGSHLFLYPFAGRHAHLGLASLLAWRLAQRRPCTFSIAVNDYGLELVSPVSLDWQELLDASLFTTDNLVSDTLASLNAAELAQRRFREIARISGLIFSGYPGAHKSNRQLQASSSLFYQVFRQYDPDNLLLGQAQTEVLRQELDADRLQQTLTRTGALPLRLVNLDHPSPFALPLMVERLRESLSSEKLADRITRLVGDLEREAGPDERARAFDPESLVQPSHDSDLTPRRGATARRPRVQKSGRPR